MPWGVRAVVPLIEIRVPFELPMMELDNASRGAVLDLPTVVSAAEEAAHAEDTAIFNGFKTGGVEGIIPSSPHPAIAIPDDYADYPSIVGVEHFLDGPMVLAPKVDGGVLLSHRGGDFQLSVGQDLSDGYAGRDKDTVHLYLTESFAFRALDRAAAVYLKPKRGKKVSG